MKIDFSMMPQNYVVCNPESCQRAETCLRQLGYRQVEADDTADSVNLLKPQRCSADTDFAYYKSCEPVRFARGFTNFEAKLTKIQYKEFIHRMKEKYNHATYYRLYRGEILISLDKQQEIETVLEEVGYGEKPVFDTYEDKLNW